MIAYGDVRPTKPSGKGVELAMKQCDVRYINHVVMVGDIDVDLKAAYNAGVWAVLDRSAWPAVRAREHWNALEFVADGDLRAPGDLLEFLSCPDAFLPELERLRAAQTKDEQPPGTTKSASSSHGKWAATIPASSYTRLAGRSLDTNLCRIGNSGTR